MSRVGVPGASAETSSSPSRTLAAALPALPGELQWCRPSMSPRSSNWRPAPTVHPAGAARRRPPHRRQRPRDPRPDPLSTRITMASSATTLRCSATPRPSADLHPGPSPRRPWPPPSPSSTTITCSPRHRGRRRRRRRPAALRTARSAAPTSSASPPPSSPSAAPWATYRPRPGPTSPTRMRKEHRSGELAGHEPLMPVASGSSPPPPSASLSTARN